MVCTELRSITSVSVQEQYGSVHRKQVPSEPGAGDSSCLETALDLGPNPGPHTTLQLGLD